MNRGKGLILGLVAVFATACASGGGAGPGDAGSGNRPSDNAQTRAAGVHIAQASMAEGAAAMEHYEQALADALAAIEASPTNPKAYLLAGQASVGTRDWVQADTMFDRALELYPDYADQISAEREQGWVDAYNLGVEAVQQGSVEQALEYFEAADMLYQGRPEARMNVGWANMRLGNTEAAIEGYRGALEILYGPVVEGMPEEQVASWQEDREIASFNLAQLLANTGRYAEAAEVLEDFAERNAGTLSQSAQLQALSARANFLAQAGEAEAAAALYDELLSRDDLSSGDYFQIGVGFFNTGDYERAIDAFRTSAEMNPHSRDAVLNLVQSQYSLALDLEKEEGSADRLRELYRGIIANSEKVRQFDPLNKNILTFMLRAYRGQGDLATGAAKRTVEQKIQEIYSVYEGLPWEVRDVSVNVQESQTVISGQLANSAGDAGTQVRLRFNLVGENGQSIASETVSVTAPAQNAAAPFTVRLNTNQPVAGWRYELIQ